jgi:hypothetical protein
MMLAVRIITWIARVAGLGALLLGLFFWVTNIDIISIHMLFGITFALSFLVLSIIMVLNSSLRVLGVVGILYSFILPIFGVTQVGVLNNGFHWLIQVAHMLVGLGALTLVQIIFIRYERVSQSVVARNVAQKMAPPARS